MISELGSLPVAQLYLAEHPDQPGDDDEQERLVVVPQGLHLLLQAEGSVLLHGNHSKTDVTALVDHIKAVVQLSKKTSGQAHVPQSDSFP